MEQFIEEINEQLLTICVDDNDYYIEGSKGNFVQY